MVRIANKRNRALDGSATINAWIINMNSGSFGGKTKLLRQV